MTGSARWRIGIAAAALALLAASALRACAPDDPARTSPLLRDTRADDAPRVVVREHVAPPAPAEPGRSTLTLHVDVYPEGSDLAWGAALYLEPTPYRDRSSLAEESGRGPATLSWDVPCDKLAVHVRCDGGVGETWREAETTRGSPAEVHVTLLAHARLEGTVRGPDGQPVRRARVVFAPTESPPRSASVPASVREPAPLISDPLTQETDDEGRFSIAGVDPRVPYTGAAASPGFAVRREYGVHVQPGRTTTQDFDLDIGCVITGRLLDSVGQPIAGAHLTVATQRDARSTDGILWDAEGEAVSADDGSFRFDSLGPGWKKVQTVLAAEKGVTVVGHWECRVERGDRRDLGDLLVRDSLFEARISVPEGGEAECAVRLGFVPDLGGGAPGGDLGGALLSVPVTPDDDGVIRVRGLPRGAIHAVVADVAARTDGRWRPRTTFDQPFDGSTLRVDWALRALLNAQPDLVDARGLPVRTVQITFPGAGDDDLALAFRDGALLALQRAGRATLTVAAVEGERIRVVRTRGDRWGDDEITVEGDARLSPAIRTDRTGSVLEVLVRDEGRPVSGVFVFVGTDRDALLPFRTTGSDGRVVLRGLPPDLGLFVSAAVRLGSRPEPQAVQWVAGRATVEVDVSED